MAIKNDTIKFLLLHQYFLGSQKLELQSLVLDTLMLLVLNPIPTGCCHVILIYGLIPPSAGRNRVKRYEKKGKMYL